MPVTRGNRVNVYFETQADMELPPILSEAMIIDITCGDLCARLHRERFICPGINRDCIEYEGTFITPKRFYVVAKKGSLKDWKNAIRINGKKIRRYLDTGELEFYNHAELCTGRCKSRIKASEIASPSGSLLNISTSSLLGKKSQMFIMPKASDGLVTDNGLNSSNESLSLVQTDSFGEARDIKPSVEQLNHMMLLNLKPGQNGDGTLEHTGADGQTQTLHPVHLVALRQNNEHEDDEDVMFWRAIVQLGLIDEFFREIKSKLDVLKVSMIKNFVPLIDAKKASLIVNELGMKSKLDMRLCAHKFEFDRQRNKLDKEMEELKRKVNEYEQKKEILQQKSDCYEQLISKKMKLDEANSHPTKFTFETSSGSTLNVNGEGDAGSRTSSPFMSASQDSSASLTSTSHDESLASADISLEYSSQGSNLTQSQPTSLEHT